MGRIALGPVASLLRRLRKRICIADNAEEVLEEIVKFQPRLIDGNTSYLRVIAETILDKGVRQVHPKAIRGDGEVLDEPTRKFLETVFECAVFDEYSAWDFGHGAWECVKREGYHIDADLLIMEIIRDGEPAAPGEPGEIVVTGLLNYAMPLIRYRVGDVGILGEDMCSCGRGLPLLKSVEGRMIDCFRLPNGRIVTPKVIMAAIQGCPGVSRYQAVQESTSRVTIELMRRKNDPQVSVEELVARCREILGDDVEIEVFMGDRKNLKAKFRPVVSRLTVSGETRWTKPRVEA
jgi:phenylacetate-CoA ligase